MAYACTQPNALVGRELEKTKAAQPLNALTKPTNAQTPPQAATDVACPPMDFIDEIEVCKSTPASTTGQVTISTFGSCLSSAPYYVEFYSQPSPNPPPQNAALPGRIFTTLPYKAPFYTTSYINTSQTLYHVNTFNLTNIPASNTLIWVRVYQLPFNINSSSWTPWKKGFIFSGNGC